MPTAVATGANPGIGNAFARLLIDEGWTVYAVDREIGPNIRDLDVNASHGYHVTLNKTLTTNAFGPLLLTQALLPGLTLSPSPRISNMSSRVGSMADNSTGGSYAYRASKAALKSISKNLAIELEGKGIVVVIMHPGITRTAMDPSEHKRAGAVEPEVAAEKLYKVLMEKQLEDSGKFWHREGYEIPW
ncbi:hypothetical protein GP486_003910 [Trichoglossum hirsutum]|uniref:C-factor n=1 Tax=Trichoglossum hirsutum TaxID=265104 RepID=A0A9P8LC55_9PEZI|nr:hypothetical protein GP486_003910 [Trichoglossum hirsutum]